ncbi:MAG: hypothetical protein HY276_07885, partial [Ignavibacteriales bacterium]|nr:hypothetical protein [Ignavibacteriales bacterium]
MNNTKYDIADATREGSMAVIVQASPVTNLLNRDQVKGPLLQETETKTKKIPAELRKKKINFSQEPIWYKRLVWRLKEDSQFLRSTVQFSFALLCVWIGIEFYLFAKWGSSGGAEPFFARPPGAEGFLPI